MSVSFKEKNESFTLSARLSLYIFTASAGAFQDFINAWWAFSKGSEALQSCCLCPLTGHVERKRESKATANTRGDETCVRRIPVCVRFSSLFASGLLPVVTWWLCYNHEQVDCAKITEEKVHRWINKRKSDRKDWQLQASSHHSSKREKKKKTFTGIKCVCLQRSHLHWSAFILVHNEAPLPWVPSIFSSGIDEEH